MPTIPKSEAVKKLEIAINEAIKTAYQKGISITKDQNQRVEAIRKKIIEKENIEKMLAIYMDLNGPWFNEDDNTQPIDNDHFDKLKEALEKTIHSSKFKELILETPLTVKISDKVLFLISVALLITLAVIVIAGIFFPVIAIPIAIVTLALSIAMPIAMLAYAAFYQDNHCNARDKVNKFFQESVRQVQKTNGNNLEHFSSINSFENDRVKDVDSMFSYNFNPNLESQNHDTFLSKASDHAKKLIYAADNSNSCSLFNNSSDIDKNQGVKDEHNSCLENNSSPRLT